VGLALGTASVVLVVLAWELVRPLLKGTIDRARVTVAERACASPLDGYDPGRERRAEQRARELLRSCVSREDWEMYRDLGLLRVLAAPRSGRPDEPAPHAYLIYPHKPIVAFAPETGELLSEHCVAFPDGTRPYGSPRLPDSDDVLAKWMALAGDERRLIAEANMHLPGRQVDPERVRRDLIRIERWERARGDGTALQRPGSVRAA